MIQKIAGLCICFLASVVSTFSQTALNSKVGTVNPIEGRFVCLVIPNSKLTPGMKIQVVLPDKPQLVKSGVIEARVEKSCSSDNDVVADPSFYKVRMRRTRDLDYGIGVIGAKRIKVVNGLARADLNNDGKLEYFRTCTSMEGIHSTIWTGKPLKGKRIWHSYYYLGYDTEPSCKNRDFR